MFHNTQKFVWSLLLALSLSTVLLGQQSSASVEGKITDTTTGGVVDFASVAVLRQQDSTVVDFQLADENGEFHIAGLSPGTYFLNINRMSFEDVQTPGFRLEAGEKRRVDVTMEASANLLNTVEVTSYRPTVSFAANKMTVAVDQLVGRDNSNGLEILDQVPGIFVDGRSITLNGMGNVTVLFNGRRKTMTGQQAATLLESIPASSIKSIVVTNGKSVDQDAAGSGGEINIITDRNVEQLYNLNLSNRITIDRELSNSHNVYLNWNGQRLRFNGGVGFNRNFSYGSARRNELYFDDRANEMGSIDHFSETNSLNLLPSFNLGLEYDLTETQRIGASANSYFTDGETEHNRISTTGGVFAGDDILFREENDLRDNLTTADLYYENDLDTLGSELRLTLGYLTGFSRENPIFTRRQPPNISLSEGTRLQAQLPLDGAQVTFRADFTKYLNPNAHFKLGVKLTDGEIENFATYDTISFQPPRRNLALSDSLRYRERVYAAYAAYQQKLGNFAFEGGVRMEHSAIETQSYKVDLTGTQNYTNLFPNVSLSYDGGQQIRASLNYSASITRPDYLQLNPYVRFVDAFTFRAGNNTLLPQISHRVSFTAQLFQFLNLNLGYLNGTNYTQDVRRLGEDGVTTTITPENAYRAEAIYALTTIYFRFGQGGRLRGQLSGLVLPFQYTFYEQFQEPGIEGTEDTKVTISGGSQYKITDRLSFENSFYYLRGRTYFQGETADRWRLGLGFRYKVPGDALTLVVNLSDVFNTFNAAGDNFFPGYAGNYFSDFNTRRLSVSANYRLGKLRKNYQRGPSGEVDRFRAE